MDVRVPSPRDLVAGAEAVRRSGLVRLYRPDRLLRLTEDLLRYRMTPATGPSPGAVLYPDAPSIIDDSGAITMRELDRRCSAAADGLSASGLAAGDHIGVLARNSADFYEVAVGASRLGLHVTYLNVGFTLDQLGAIVAHRRLQAVVHDDEFADRVPTSVRAIATGAVSGAAVEQSADAAKPPLRPGRPSEHVILTSGTTGYPKDVPRTRGGFESVVSLLSGLPFRVRERHLIAAPLFHGWGWLNLLLTMLLSDTVVLSRRFDPERTLALIEQHRCEVLVVVPAMLRRIMDLPAATRRRYDTGCLRVAAVSGSAMPPSLAAAFMDEFGDVLYNLYGSTEAAFVSVAGPAELRSAPGTAGRPLPMVRVRVVNDLGRDAAAREPGVIVVRGRDAVPVEDAGAARRTVRTGDLGWFDEAGRLFVAGREDDMVIVGGENVYPVVVETVLDAHPDIVESAVVGTADRVLGQALVAHVVKRRGSRVNATELRAWCRARLAPFQVPRRFVFHRDLPHGETGKVLKRCLAA